MPGCLSNASKKTAFIVISFLLLTASSTRAGEDFEAGLEEGRSHGTEILSRHSEILRPSSATPEAVPRYGEQARQKLSSEGSQWTDNPEGMRTEAERTMQDGDPATSDAPRFLKQSSARRPTFTIDPETDPMIRNSRDAIENPVTQCEKKEVCTEYAESSWNEREECYDQATLQRLSCNVIKTVTVTERTENWRYMTLEIDRNDGGAGFSASIDTDGDGFPDASLYAPGCLDRRSGDVWGDFGGFTLGGSYWKGCFTLGPSGFAVAPDETCVATFGPTASTGRLPLGDGAAKNASLQNVLASAIRAKFPPPPGSQVTGVIEASWGRARRCRAGDGNGNGWRVAYTATRTVYETNVETDDRCGSYEGNLSCELSADRCTETAEIPGAESVCANRERTYLCAGSLIQGPDCADLRADGCYQIGGSCVMRFREHPEFPDPPGADLGACLIHENIYECPRNISLCRQKSVAFDCDGEIRCTSGEDCFDTETEQSADFPRAASRMAMLADMERCLATTADGESSAEGYGPIEVDGIAGTTAGPIDCADTSGGEVTIFKGKRYRCDLNLAGFIQNCCRKKGLFSGACPAATKELRARRDDARACHYVGIHKKKVLGITLKKRKVYCCFNSKMARVVHEQARGQLIEKGLWDVTENGGWGRAKNPFCGGMSAQQLQEIDFDVVDFSEIYADLLDEASIPELADSTQSVEEEIEDLCPEDSESLACGGDEEE
ncbi:MAG: hypothetical protein F4Y78_06675 [Candidatus Dadabacteria bacterium]|nr:hypothetical protein [Candidatus Dadabacteria bacterium]MYA48776.1 hypothetical protein [Candidatus Dadabacteria bacterium]MYF48277.1 hypothetical protein [Candidatus Dadabacteria bacterium]MYG82410.1 hypothetical protein [Candidatus Dadabacteria bacterium]MYK49348.1 hypothetical protein [Candidatus Dadabacteria bacterium]